MNTKVWKKDTTVVIPTDDPDFYNRKEEYIAFMSGEESPHKNLIAAWSKGAPIEAYHEKSEGWYLVAYPTWKPEHLYRIREMPSGNPRVEAIRAEMLALEEELKGMRNG